MTDRSRDFVKLSLQTMTVAFVVAYKTKTTGHVIALRTAYQKTKKCAGRTSISIHANAETEIATAVI